MRRLLAALIAALVAAACTSTGAPSVSPSGSASAAPVHLTVIWTAVTGANSGLWTAFEAGYFKDEGLDVEFSHIASSPRSIEALVSGEAQFGTADGLNLVQAVASGADVKAVLGVTNRLVFSVMTQPAIKTPTDLRGKKIGITRVGSSTHTAALAALRIWKLDPNKDVSFLQLNEVPSILTGMIAKQADAGVVSPPTNTLAKKQGFNELLNLATDGPDYLSVSIATSGRYLRERPDVVERFVRAYARGAHRFKTDAAFGKTAINTYLKLDDQSVLQDTYDQFVKYIALPPYATGIDPVIADALAADPKMKAVTADQVVDTTVVKKLDQAGFFANLK